MNNAGNAVIRKTILDSLIETLMVSNLVRNTMLEVLYLSHYLNDGLMDMDKAKEVGELSIEIMRTCAMVIPATAVDPQPIQDAFVALQETIQTKTEIMKRQLVCAYQNIEDDTGWQQDLLLEQYERIRNGNGS